MRLLEQRITESRESSVANASLAEMQQIKSADNRILQEQLQNKCLENQKLQERIASLEHKLAIAVGDNDFKSYDECGPKECTDDLRKKVKLQPSGD